MSSNTTLGVETRACKRKRERDANAGDAIPGLLNDIVVSHVLRSEHFDDPADLARLRAVSRAMNDAVTATGLQFEELDEHSAVVLGCLSAIERLQRTGQLQNQVYLCHAAARSGQLEKLRLLRENNTPWNTQTCAMAATSRHFEVLQWLRVNGCPWDWMTCAAAATYSGHPCILQWARANGCPWDRTTRDFASGHILEWAVANGVPEYF